jgi:transglutaminase-like putative cysteine protease
MEYGRNILAASFNRTLDFLVNLTSRIHVDFTAETRLQGEPYSPDTTFRLRKGSCRDLAWMQIQLVRNFGIAARFVSGYYYNHLLNNSFELHAWVEVYLPGAGWVGFDPSNGILAVSTHIPICSSAHYQNTLPVIGSFRGGASSTMDVSLSIEKI